MNQFTIGQRIASRRKLLNLSQEGLAEQLSVSRQAVSKWESDATIPEIDKLIALGRIFDVNVGWILGVENEGENFSEAQLQTVEQLIIKHQPSKKRRWLRIVAALCALFVIFSAFAYMAVHINVLTENNQAMYDQISLLNADNTVLKGQIDQMNELLTQQNGSKQLLSKVQMRTFADETLENVSVAYYLTPKFYHAGSTAYLHIQNPGTGYNEMVECVWNEYQGWYVAPSTIPAKDGYKISFLLVNDYGYEEENLVLRDPGIPWIGTYCNFHLSPSDPHFALLLRQEPLEMSSSQKQYTFNHPIYTPHIFAETAVAYKHITITLKLNGESIWEKSYLDEFKKVMDLPSINGRNNAVLPDISVVLPSLKTGDVLQLVLTAETVNGGAPTQTYETILNNRVITE